MKNFTTVSYFSVNFIFLKNSILHKQYKIIQENKN